MNTSKSPQERIAAIFVNGEEIARLHCSPFNLDELAIGFLLNDGYISDFKEIRSVKADDKMLTVHVDAPSIDTQSADVAHRASGCGAASRLFNSDAIKKRKHVGIVPEDLQMNAKLKEMMRHTRLYAETGGVHCSALADEKGLIVVREDIGRHNTFDKIVGHAMLKGLDPSKLIVLTTGRISYEMMYKIVLTGFPAAASLTAATDLAVELAKEFGIAAFGYVRGGNYTIYNLPDNEKAGCLN